MKLIYRTYLYRSYLLGRFCPRPLSHDGILGHAWHELFQIEWCKVGHVLKLSAQEGHFGQGEHVAGQRTHVVHEIGVGMHEQILALGRTSTEEIHGPFGQLLRKTIFGDDRRVNVHHGAKRAIVQCGIDFHAARIEHRTEQCIFGQFLVEQQGCAEHLERGHGYQRQVSAEAYTLSRGQPYAQSRIRTWSATHGHSIQRQGMAVGKGHHAIHESRQHLCVRRAFQVHLLCQALAIATEGYATDFRGRFYVKDIHLLESFSRGLRPRVSGFNGSLWLPGFRRGLRPLVSTQPAAASSIV